MSQIPYILAAINVYLTQPSYILNSPPDPPVHLALSMSDVASPSPPTTTTTPTMSLLVVGAGFTGSILCKILRTTAPQLTLNVWEKSRGIGGRQAIKRDGEHSCDIGTQYITHFKSDKLFEPYVKELRSTNVIQKFEVGVF